MVIVASAIVALAGCVTQETLPQPLSSAHKAEAEVPEPLLLDVGVGIFDANVPATEKEQLSEGVDPDVRTAEARYMPVLLAKTLQDTGYWGQVRVVPRGLSGLRRQRRRQGPGLERRGVKLAIKATDATGHEWLSKTYHGEPDTRAYKTGASITRDPFQNLYVQIADDLAAARAKLKPADFTRIRDVARLRFESELAPFAYQGYLQRQRDGTYRVLRLPAEDSPLDERLQQVRERDYALLDTLDDQYQLSADRITDSYVNWRRSNYTELETETELKHSAAMRMLLGAAAVVGGIAAATNSGSSSATQVAGALGVGAGIEAFKSGMGQRAEAKAHAESLKQQTDSFSAEVAPMNVEVEGKVVELKGTGEQQFMEWRRLLKELYQNETGLAGPGGGRRACQALSRAQATMFEAGYEIVDRFVLTRRLGGRDQAPVWEALDRGNGVLVVLKLRRAIPPASRRNSRRCAPSSIRAYCGHANSCAAVKFPCSSRIWPRPATLHVCAGARTTISCRHCCRWRRRSATCTSAGSCTATSRRPMS